MPAGSLSLAKRRQFIEALCTITGIAMPHTKQCTVCGAVMVKPPNQRLDHPNWIRRSVCGQACRKNKVCQRAAFDFAEARRTRRFIVDVEYEQ